MNIYIFATIDYQPSILPPMWHITSDNLTMFSLLPSLEEYLNWPHHSKLIFPKHQPFDSHIFHAIFTIFWGCSTAQTLVTVKPLGSPRSPRARGWQSLAEGHWHLGTISVTGDLRGDLCHSQGVESDPWDPALEKGRVRDGLFFWVERSWWRVISQ